MIGEVAARDPHSCSLDCHRPSEPITVSANLAHWLSRQPKRVRRAVTPAYALRFHLTLNSSETLRLTRISRVCGTERAQVAEGQDTKWPDGSVALGKFHPHEGQKCQLAVSF